MANVSGGRRLVAVSVVALGILVLVSPVSAQAPREEARIALLIGNSAYRESPLRNPVNDVRAMAQRLKELGFTALVHENATAADGDGKNELYTERPASGDDYGAASRRRRSRAHRGHL